MIISVFDRKYYGKRRNCLYKQFFLDPQCFLKASFLAFSKDVIVWEWLNPLPNNKILALDKFEAFQSNLSTLHQTKKLLLNLKKVKSRSHFPRYLARLSSLLFVKSDNEIRREIALESK